MQHNFSAEKYYPGTSKCRSLHRNPLSKCWSCSVVFANNAFGDRGNWIRNIGSWSKTYEIGGKTEKLVREHKQIVRKHKKSET